MRNITIACFCICAGAATLAQTVTPISNLNQPTSGYYENVSVNYELGTAFITGNNAMSLSSFSISLDGVFPDFSGHLPGPLNLFLYADASGLPGSILTTMVNSSGISSPINPGIYSYVPASPTVLQPNTRYWIVANSSMSGRGASYSWNATPLISLDAGSSWVEGASVINNGGSWNVVVGSQLLFSVTVPGPPPLAIAQSIVLTYTNANGNDSYILQQNSDLATTNWVNVTNATLSGVLDNQVVFIVPPSASRLFYRLSPP